MSPSVWELPEDKGSVRDCSVSFSLVPQSKLCFGRAPQELGLEKKPPGLSRNDKG